MALWRVSGGVQGGTVGEEWAEISMQNFLLTEALQNRTAIYWHGVDCNQVINILMFRLIWS